MTLYTVHVPVKIEGLASHRVAGGWRYQYVRDVEASDQAGAELVAVTRCVVQYQLDIMGGVPLITFPDG